MRADINIILPCAGKGTRLGLPFPKELAPLGPGRVVIDSCLDLVAHASAHSNVRILFLEDGNRFHTIRHIVNRVPHVPIARVAQPPEVSDFGTAILGLEQWFGACNVVLLPDGAYDKGPIGDPVLRVAEMAARSGFAFGAAIVPPERVSKLGALKVRLGRVEQYAEKPADPAPYNAAWTMLGFSGGHYGITGLELVRLAMNTGETIVSPPVKGAEVAMISGYRDCGTWEGYREVMKETASE